MTNWYIYIVIAVVAALLFWACDKFRIIKSKPLRIFIAILVSSVLCWVVYDLVVA